MKTYISNVENMMSWMRKPIKPNENYWHQSSSNGKDKKINKNRQTTILSLLIKNEHGNENIMYKNIRVLQEILRFDKYCK